MASQQPQTPRRYAFVGTGSRAQMYLAALLGTHACAGDPVALCDTNEVRMSYYDRLIEQARPGLRLPHYAPGEFDTMLKQTKPSVLFVTSPDATHAAYVSHALSEGIDVVVEKPMTTDLAGLRQIRDALAASTAKLTVTFNYRYSPRNSMVRRLIADGIIGDVTSVNFEWCLDTVHGADYFRRWHRDKSMSGGLLVHKATHHFDLVNWWLGDVPEVVFARGGLHFYGESNAHRRGLAPRPERARDADASDPFAFDITADKRLRQLYYDGEHLDGYVRDRDVFSTGISIEDNLNLVAGYHRGAAMSYTLHAHSPWEGYRVAINGTAGRLELDVVERGHVLPATATSAVGAATATAGVIDPSATPDGLTVTDTSLRPAGTRLLLQRHWEPAHQVAIPAGHGSHGGGDTMLLDDIFHGTDNDLLSRPAGFNDGAASILVGVAGNESLRTGKAIYLKDFGLVPLETPGAGT